MQKNLINIGLTIVVFVMVFLLYKTIADPIAHQKEINRREQAIIERLEKVREAQLAFKDITGKFANSWDTLINVMRNGEVNVEIQYGDADDSTTVFRKEIIKKPIYQELFSDYPLDSIFFVPFTNDTFDIATGEVEKNGVLLPTFQITDPAPYNERRVENNNALRVGNLFEADYNGNW